MGRCKRVVFVLAASLFNIAAYVRPSSAAMVLLNGASTPDAQGWTAVSVSVPAASVVNNGTYTEISTLGTTDGGSASGDLMYNESVALSSMPVYQLDISLQVLAGSGSHNQFDAPVAFGANNGTASGSSVQRGEKIYFDTNGIGWGDESGSYAFDTTDTFHTYSLIVDTNTGDASVAVDGVQRLTRSGYVTSDQIGFGDQTNDPGVNGDFRIEEITLTPEPASLYIFLLASIAVLTQRGSRRKALNPL